jgi:hypothetical protein
VERAAARRFPNHREVLQPLLLPRALNDFRLHLGRLIASIGNSIEIDLCVRNNACCADRSICGNGNGGCESEVGIRIHGYEYLDVVALR